MELNTSPAAIPTQAQADIAKRIEQATAAALAYLDTLGSEPTALERRPVARAMIEAGLQLVDLGKSARIRELEGHLAIARKVAQAACEQADEDAQDRALRAAAQAATAEPVAQWQRRELLDKGTEDEGWSKWRAVDDADAADNTAWLSRRPGKREVRPLYTAPVAGQAEDAVRHKERDDVIEAVRQRLCKLQRYSFHLGFGGVRRVPDRYGNWLVFAEVHTLFDPVVVDAAIRQSQEAPPADRDQARYQYLRSRDLNTVNEGGVFAGMTPQNLVLNGKDLDRAIDAALAAREAQDLKGGA